MFGQVVVSSLSLPFRQSQVVLILEKKKHVVARILKLRSALSGESYIIGNPLFHEHKTFKKRATIV